MTFSRSAHYGGLGTRTIAGRGLGAGARTARGDDRDWLSAASTRSGIDLRDVASETWMALGESFSKCAHFIHSPLLPEWADDLTRRQVREAVDALVALAHRERAVDGSAEQVAAPLRDACTAELHELGRERVHRRSLGITPQWLHAQHARLHGGGPLTAAAIAVLQPPCESLHGPAFAHAEPPVHFALGFVRAVALHHALLQSRPFGASSAAVARLAEIGALLELDEISIRQAGLLSVHYAATDDAYDRFRNGGGSAVEFIDYAALGFRDAVRRQMHDTRTFFPDRRAELFRANAASVER
jgi:hypothetical protein